MAWANAKKVNKTKGGWGYQHQKLRAALLPNAYGKPCYRCGMPMLPGQELHLDHTDDRTGYGGFSHKRCNLRAAAKKARAIQLYSKQIKAAHRW